MAQEITVTRTEDHYEMQFDGGSSYPVPEHAIETLDDDLTPEEPDESVTFVGDYGGHKHLKSFDVEEVVKTPGDEGEEGDKDSMDAETDAEPAPAPERFDVGDRVENPSQRRGEECVVVEVGRDEDIFGNPTDVLVIERADGRGRTDDIPERYHDNWRLAG